MHGDDFTGVWTEERIGVVRIRAQEVLDCGFAWNSRSAANVAHSITILNRLVTWTDRGIEVEADPRHVDLLLSEVPKVQRSPHHL